MTIGVGGSSIEAELAGMRSMRGDAAAVERWLQRVAAELQALPWLREAVCIGSRGSFGASRNAVTESAISSPARCGVAKPMALRFKVSAPALVVITRITLRKSALRPLLSVKVP